MPRITLTSPKSQPVSDRVEITEVQIRRWATPPSIEFNWAEGYLADEKFVPKDMHREQIPDASKLLGAKVEAKHTIEESLIHALLAWLVENNKVAGKIA